MSCRQTLNVLASRGGKVEWCRGQRTSERKAMKNIRAFELLYRVCVCVPTRARVWSGWVYVCAPARARQKAPMSPSESVSVKNRRINTYNAEYRKL